jgi:hypothetical protein
MSKKVFFITSVIALSTMIEPIVSSADDALSNNTNPSISISSEKPSKNPLLADEPTIAKVPPYAPESTNNENPSSNVNSRDVLVKPLKNVIGGSAHQNNQINKYLGVNY